LNFKATAKVIGTLKVFNEVDPVKFSFNLPQWANGFELASHLRLLINFLHSAYSPPGFDYNHHIQHSLVIENDCFIVFK
jgi:hypothetical protein